MNILKKYSEQTLFQKKYLEALLPYEVLPPNYRHWQGGGGGEKGGGEGQDQGAKLDYHPEIEYRSSPGSR